MKKRVIEKTRREDMKVLLTGFDPFGGEIVNPSFEAVKELPENILGAEIIKKEIPTEFLKSQKVLKELILEINPDIILSIGQAGGRASITLEKVGINLMEARIEDNSGFQPEELEIVEDGPTAYFSTLPLKEMQRKICETGIPAHISYTAGTFVCNTVLYSALNICEKEGLNTKAGFIHVPFLPEQVVNKKQGTPSMSKEEIKKALIAAIESILEKMKI